MMPPEMGQMPPGMGPDPLAGGPPPPGSPAGPPPGMGMPGQDPFEGVGAEEWIKVAIEAAKKAADADETDNIETADVMKAINVLQGLLAGRQKQDEALMGGGPATKALSRAYGG